MEKVGYIGQGKGGFEQGKKELFMNIGSCLEQGKTLRKVALNKAKARSRK